MGERAVKPTGQKSAIGVHLGRDLVRLLAIGYNLYHVHSH